MSIETWKAEFLPVPAEEVPMGQAVAHSLRKWRGLRIENLVAHDLSGTPRYLMDREGQEAFIGACALCEHHPCHECPLAQGLGAPCDRGPNAPWHAWLDDHDPEPMIQALEETLQREESAAQP